MKKILILGAVLLILLFLVFSYLTRPTKEQMERYMKNYDEKLYNERREQYLKDSIYYSKFDSIIVVRDSLSNNELKYRTPIQTVMEERERLVQTMADKEEYERLYFVSNSGYFTFTIYSSTYGYANTGNYRVVITNKDGKEIYREDLKSSDPNVYDPSSWDKKYYGLITVSFDQQLEFPLKVFLINRLDGSRSEFTLKSNK